MPGAAANLPDALVGLAPDGLQMRDERLLERPAVLIRSETGVARDVEGVEHFAIDVELQLSGGGVADAHGLCPLIAGQPGNLVFVEPAFACDAVHRLHVVGRAGDGAQKPLAPRAGFIEEARADQRQKREGRVAQPAIAIVPVARTPDFSGSEVVPAATMPPVIQCASAFNVRSERNAASA